MKFCSALFGFLLIYLCANCSNSIESIVKVKVFALNPLPYVGVSVGLQGRMAGWGSAGAWFVLEDETGRVLVTTERLGTHFFCPVGSEINVQGHLRSMASKDWFYFSASEPPECPVKRGK